MENAILKTMAQLGVLVLLIWLLAALMGRRDEMSSKHKAPRRMDPKSPVWHQFGADAPAGSASLSLQPGYLV